MKQHIVHWLHNLTDIFNNPNNQKALFISGFAILSACLLFLFATKSSDRSNITPTHLTPSVTLVSTRWWGKAIPSSSTALPNATIIPKSAGTSGGNCPSDISSNLQPGVYAYISLIPPLSNRVRSGAGKTYSYIGQVEPGKGVKVIDGPLCADDYSWWLVESNNDHLKGWTVMGSGSEQWIIPCANPHLPCSKAPASPVTATLTTQDNGYNKCKSDMFTTGIFAQVKQGDLLVIRSGPYTGTVIGYAGPMSIVKIIDGPHCVGAAIWWKVNISKQNLTGWAIEANLTICSKEDECM